MKALAATGPAVCYAVGPMASAIHTTMLACCLCPVIGACTPTTYVPELATRAYPEELHTTDTVAMQCFRRGTELEIVNATPRSFSDINMWINQRYVHAIPRIAAGETIRISLWDFFDVYGHRFYAGGLFRSYPAEPVRLVELQLGPDEPMVGLIAIRNEIVVEPQRQ